MAAPAYHGRTHIPGGTDPIPFGGHGPWIELDLVNGFTGGPLEYRHAPGSPGGGGDEWELEWRGHIDGPSGTYCGILPSDDRPPDDKYGITEGEADDGNGIVVEWYIEASTGYVFITFPVGGGGSGGTGVDPWLVQISPIFGYTVVQGSFAINGDSNQTLFGGYLFNSAGVQNDEITFPVGLSAGTWRIDFLFVKTNASGIITFSIDGSSVGTIDTYAASATYNQTGSITGISIGSTGVKTLSLKTATKNGSSSAYKMFPVLISLVRTA